MSESAEVKLSQNASNSDLVENEVIIEANGDHNSDPNVVPTIRPDVDNCIESKTIECGDNSESEQDFATTVVNRVTQLNGITMNGMRSIDADATQVPDVCSGSRHIDDGVDGMREESSQDSNTAQSTSESICGSDNEVIIIETVVKSESNEVTLITDTTIKTTINENSNQSITDSQNNKNIDKNNDSNNLNNNKSETMTTTTTSRPKQLKGLLKKGVKTNGERKRVKFSETMQVFCDDWPQNLMPQIIALKSPTDFNLVEVQGYMFEPPVEYQDFLPFDPPPDYRDLIANSLCAFDNDLSINYIDDEEDDDNNTLLKSNIKSEQKILNEFSSKWESMILNNNESLEEEQIIGVLKEDAILQAIGSHISLPEENLCPEDFPIHFPNNKTSESNIKLAESELSDITSDDGNDSSPTGSLQDIQSDSSITSQDTIILINTDSNDNNDNFEVYSNKSIFNEINTNNSEDISYQKNTDCVVNCQSKSENRSTKSDQLNDSFEKAMISKINESLNCEEPNEQNIECDVKRVSAEEEEEVVSSPDVTHNIDKKYVKTNEIHENESNNESKPTDAELNSEQKQINLFSNEESNELLSNHSNSFRRNLQFYENMFSNNINKSDNTSNEEKQQKQSHRVSHFFIQNNPKYPVITQTISNNINDNNVKQINESSIEIKQNSNQIFENSSNLDNCPPMAPTRAPTQQTSHTQPNSNNWSADEFIVEYTSEPKALVPSKRTASLSNFATAQMSNNLQILRNNPNISSNNNNQYLSLNRNGEIPKLWNAYNMDSHNNSSQVLYPNQNPPIQRSLSPNPPMVSTSMRPVSPQQTLYYQNRPQYTPRYPPTNTMPVHVMYNHMSGLQPVQQRLSVRLPIMTQTLGPPHKKPPPYHYHIQQHNNEFPNPSEIRRRDGLNAYPHILNQMPTAGALPVPPIHHNNSNNQTPPQNALPQNLTKDELEQFVQQDIQRTERIKKRYSMTEEDDPSFGFARRPSVRGIRPKFESTTEILKQMQTPNNNAVGSQITGSHTSWPQNNYSNNNQQMSNTLPKKPHIVQIRFQPQNPLSAKYMNETPESTQVLHTKTMSGQQTSRTLPRPSSLISQSQMNAIRSEDGFVIRLPANVSRDQLKQQIQRQIEQQFQSKAKQKTNTSSMPSNAKPMMSSNDERGAPEGASSSPKHSSDLLFAKNLSSNSNTNVKSTETTANRQQTNDTKKLVINPENNTNSETTNENQSQGVIYYAMNV